MKVILTVGIPASGKTTWAKAFVNEEFAQGKTWLNINQDDIRLDIIRADKAYEGLEIDEAKELKSWDYAREGTSELRMKAVWEQIVKDAIESDFDVIIISDTNLDYGGSKTAKLVSLGIKEEDISLEMFPISLEEAIERDRNRKFSVGEEVLKILHARLVATEEKLQVKNRLSM